MTAVPVKTNPDDADVRTTLEDIRGDLDSLAREVNKTSPVRLTGIGGSSATRVAAVTSSLTAGRVVYVGVGPILTDSANLTFSGTVLTIGTTTGSTLVVSSTTASTTTTSGCALFGGGVGVAGRLCAGSVLGANLTSGRLPLVSTGGLISNDAAHLWGTSTLTVGDGGASAYSVRLDAAAAQRRTYSFLTAGVDRWGMRADNDAESGSAAGSTWRLVAFDDAGSTIDSPISVTRAAAGSVTIVRPVALSTASTGLTISRTTGATLVVASTTASSSSTTGCATFAGGVGIGADSFLFGGFDIRRNTFVYTDWSCPASGSSTNRFRLRWDGATATFQNVDTTTTHFTSTSTALTLSTGLVVTRGTMAAAAQGISYTGTTTATSGNTWGMLAAQTINPGSASTANISGIAGNCTISTTSFGISGGVIGLDGAIDANATANTFNSLTGLRGTVRVGGAGQSITNLYGIQADLNTSAVATIGTRRGIYVTLANTGSSVIATDYGVYVENVSNATTNYAIYTNSGQCRFGDATGSTSITTGGAIFSGGVGIAGRLYVGGNLTGQGGTNAFGTSIDGEVIVTNTNTSAGTSAYSIFQATNNASVFGQVISFGSANTSTAFGVTRGNYVVFQGSGASLAGVIIGARLVDKPIIFGINNTEVARFTATGVFQSSNSTASTSTTTGGATFAGGVGVVGSLYAGAAIVANAVSAEAILRVTRTGTTPTDWYLTTGGAGGLCALYDGTNARFVWRHVQADNATFFDSDLDASSSSAAALVSLGGISAAKSIWCAAGAGQFVNIGNSTGELRVNGTRVVSVRKTGWALPTGTSTRTTFDTATVTTAQLAERIKALIEDFHSTAGHGLIGT